MKTKQIHRALLILMIIFLIIPGLVAADSKEFFRYYYKNGTFYKYTYSSLYEYFHIGSESKEGSLANIDWKELDNRVLALKVEKEQNVVEEKESEKLKLQQEMPKANEESKPVKPSQHTQQKPKEQAPPKVVINQAEFEQEVIRLTNKEREKHGLVPLKLAEKLAQVARGKSLDMAKNKYFSHDSPTYGSPFDMMENFGITYYSAGENIAKGQTSPQEVVQAWMDSEGHRENILQPDFTHIGVGFEEKGYHWTQQFIKALDTSVNASAFEEQVVELTNQERSNHGLAPLTLDPMLREVAREKSIDMAKNNYFDHTSPTYGSPFDMMDKFGVTYQTAGENIARGQFTPEEVVQAWMNSEGHRANILNPDYTHIGVGFVRDKIIWTQQFIGKK